MGERKPNDRDVPPGIDAEVEALFAEVTSGAEGVHVEPRKIGPVSGISRVAQRQVVDLVAHMPTIPPPAPPPDLSEQGQILAGVNDENENPGEDEIEVTLDVGAFQSDDGIDGDDGRKTPVVDVTAQSQPFTTDSPASTSSSDVSTRPAPYINVQQLFEMSRSPVPPRPDLIREPIIQEKDGPAALVETIAAVMKGTYGSIKPMALPRELTPNPATFQPAAPDSPSHAVSSEAAASTSDDGFDDAPILEVGEAEDVFDPDEFGQEEQETVRTHTVMNATVGQCMKLFHEMNIYFDGMDAGFDQFEWRGDSLTDQQKTSVRHYFLRQMSHLLAKHVLDGKSNVVQTKTGLLAGKLAHRVVSVQGNSFVSDDNDMAIMKLIVSLLESFPVDSETRPIAEAFIDQLDFSIFDRH